MTSPGASPCIGRRRVRLDLRHEDPLDVVGKLKLTAVVVVQILEPDAVEERELRRSPSRSARVALLRFALVGALCRRSPSTLMLLAVAKSSIVGLFSRGESRRRFLRSSLDVLHVLAVHRGDDVVRP